MSTNNQPADRSQAKRDTLQVREGGVTVKPSKKTSKSQPAEPAESASKEAK